jgi:hypothetical protein
MFIPDPRSQISELDFIPIPDPDPGKKKAMNPGSVTLEN